MQTAIYYSTTVLTGGKIEMEIPQYPEGTRLNFIVYEAIPPSELRQFSTAGEFLETLPKRKYDAGEWEQMEQEFREEREAWDR